MKRNRDGSRKLNTKGAQKERQKRKVFGATADDYRRAAIPETGVFERKLGSVLLDYDIAPNAFVIEEAHVRLFTPNPETTEA